MKTAISIPDQVFKRADRLARSLRISRSQLYSEAVAAYVAQRTPGAITAAINAAIRASGGDKPDPFVEAAADATLKRSEW